MNYPHASVANRFSVYPVAQQVVGALTIGSNLVKLGGDVVKTVNNHAVNVLSNLAQKPDNFINKFSAKTDYFKHSVFIVAGFIRMIPGLGTYISLELCKKQEKDYRSRLHKKCS